MNVYLDHAATTPLDPAVRLAMEPFLTEKFGNPSSVHSRGREARYYLEECRARVAEVLGASPSEIIFTSGGTESDNVALGGVAGESGTVLVGAAEHEAVLRPSEQMEKAGTKRLVVPVDEHGRIQAEALERALGSVKTDRCLVSIMFVNNEVGAVNDIALLAALAHDYRAVFHTDAVQSALLEIDVDSLCVDLLTLSGHKIYGPKGVGILYVRNGTDFNPLIRGGSQERGRRAGTENLPAIVGFTRALELANEQRESRKARITELRDRLRSGILGRIGDDVVENSPAGDHGSPHIFNIAVPPLRGRRVDGEMLLLGLDVEGVQVSSGSACTSGTVRPSHVLEAMGRDQDTASAAVRYSLGKDTTEQDVDYAVERTADVVRRLRQTAVPVNDGR